MNVIEYLSDCVQNKNINNIDISIGNILDENIFLRNIESKYKLLYDEFINYHNKTIIKKKCFIFNNYHLIKTDKNTYYKETEYDSCFIPNNNLDLFIKLSNKKEINQIDFPNQKEYDLEYTTTEICIKISDYVYINLIDDKYITINLTKNSYIDNSIEELNKLLNIIGNICN